MIRPISTKNTVLLICDVQERFRSAIHGFDAMSGIIAKMVKAAKLLQIPALATEQNPKGTSADTQVSLADGAALGVTVSELGMDSLPENLNFGVFPKTKFSMVIPPVEEIFQKRSIESAIIVGIESHVCVLQTTLDLLASNIRVYVLADAVSSCNRQEVPIALARLRQACAVITTSESILFELMRDSSSPLFKSFSGLIKEEKGVTARAMEILLEPTPKSSL